MSTAPSYVSDDLKRNWDKLNKNLKNSIKNEICQAVKENRAGMQCDIEVWEEILKLS